MDEENLTYSSEAYSQKQRDYGPAQVKDVSEIISGREYVFHTFNRERREWEEETFVVEQGPYEREGRWWIIVRSTVMPSISGELSLADHGVVPYEHGRWNALNWLEDPDKTSSPNA